MPLLRSERTTRSWATRRHKTETLTASGQAGDVLILPADLKSLVTLCYRFEDTDSALADQLGDRGNNNAVSCNRTKPRHLALGFSFPFVTLHCHPPVCESCWVVLDST